MSFIFASSHLPETRAQRPEDEEEEKDTQPKLSSGGVRAFSHLPQRDPSVARSAGTAPLTQPGNANLSHTQTLEYRTPDAQPGIHSKTLEYRIPPAQPGHPLPIGGYRGGKHPKPEWQPDLSDILKPKPSPYVPDWLKPDTDHEDDPVNHEPPDLSPPLKPHSPDPRLPAFVLPEWLQRQINTAKKRPTHPDGHSGGLLNENLPNTFDPSRIPKRWPRLPGLSDDQDQQHFPEGWKPQLID